MEIRTARQAAILFFKLTTSYASQSEASKYSIRIRCRSVPLVAGVFSPPSQQLSLLLKEARSQAQNQELLNTIARVGRHAGPQKSRGSSLNLLVWRTSSEDLLGLTQCSARTCSQENAGGQHLLTCENKNASDLFHFTLTSPSHWRNFLFKRAQVLLECSWLI